MPLIQTSELTGAALDWAVAKCEGLEVYFDDGVVCLKGQPFDNNSHYWLPTQNWDQGGPIIEREEIGTKRNAPCSVGHEWETRGSITAKGAGCRFAYGPTPLIAAMRCYVASRFGDEVEIPEELSP